MISRILNRNVVLLEHPNRNRIRLLAEMGKTKVIELTAEQRAESEKDYRTGKKVIVSAHAVR